MMAALLLIALSPPMDVPNVVTVSATLEDDGAPVVGPVTISASLWATATGGEPVWLAPQTVLSAERGLIVISLGDDPRAPLPDRLFAQTLWLEIVVNGQTLEPRARLAAVPAALEAQHAVDADTVQGLSVEDLERLFAAPAPAPPPVAPGINIYEEGPACALPGSLTQAASCRTRRCDGGTLGCDLVCLPTTVDCPNHLIGHLAAP